MPDGRVEFEITADGRKAYASIDEITKSLKNAGVKWEKDAKTSTDQIGESFNSMLKKIVGGISAAAIGKMLLNIGKEAVSAASDLAEVQNVVDVTFGDAGSAKINSWAQNASKQFGLTETQAKRFTSTLGAMMKSAGMSGDEIVGMSTDLAGLAADMASFYNLDFDTAFQKIRSGISGETEPLKQLGINMSEANLNAFALQQGLSKTFSQMTQGEKTMLRYQYLMQATADAQGDFSRTLDGFANSKRLFETNLETLKTNLGNMLIGPVNEAIGALNAMFELLNGTKQRTVLDDFAEIDLKTGEKIAKIEATADRARALTHVLDEIGAKAEKNRKIVSDITKDAPDGSDLNNLIEKLGMVEKDATTDKDTIKKITDTPPDETKLNKLVEKLGDVREGADGSQDAIKQMADKPPEQNNLNGLIGKLDEVKANSATGRENIQKLTANAPDGTDLNSLKDTLSSISTDAGIAQDAIAGMTEPTGEAAEQNELWLETCQELVKTIPGLSEIINTQTGEIKGGTDAVRAYVSAWEQGQKGLAYRAAHEQKRGALESKSAELPGLELNYTVARYRVRQQKEELDRLREELGIGGSGYDLIARMNMTGGAAILTEQEEQWNAAIRTLGTLTAESDAARVKFDEQKTAYEEAVKAFDEEGRIIEETYAEAIAISGEWSEAQQDAARQVVNDLQEAVDAVVEYRDQVRAATLEQVNSTLHGFTGIKTAQRQYEEAANAAREYREELEKTGNYTAEQIDLMVADKNNQITLQTMRQGLQEQLDYIAEYEKNLAIAREAGISEDILAELADGSNESALYLRAIAEAYQTGDLEGIKDLNRLWTEVGEGKGGFADALAQQKLAVDETYKSMVETAEEAAKKLNVSGTIEESTGANIAAIAKAIGDHVPEVKEQVDAILAELGRLSAWGLNINGLGIENFSAGALIGSILDGNHETGLDRVPFDGYLARLHEGEGILTAEENRVWQAFKNGQGGVDYDQLGGMIGSIKPGGDVFLDGKVVGAVVSQMQGNQFRTLQRSGWQG